MSEAEIQNLVKKHGRRPRSIDILGILGRSEQMAPKQISAKIDASAATVSQKLKELHEDGLVRSAYKDRRDRRKRAYFLTEKGKKLLAVSRFSL